MKINAKVQAALNRQIHAELYSSYLYLAMSSYCESRNLPGFARWLAAQSEEERGHAMKLYGHLHARGGEVRLEAIEAPPPTYRTLEEVFTLVVEHEEEITRKIDDLYALATSEKDYPAQIVLQWFVTEQVEEVATAMQMLERIQLVGEGSQGLLFLDRMAGERGA